MSLQKHFEISIRILGNAVRIVRIVWFSLLSILYSYAYVSSPRVVMFISVIGFNMHSRKTFSFFSNRFSGGSRKLHRLDFYLFHKLQVEC